MPDSLATVLEQTIRAHRPFDVSAPWAEELIFPYYDGLSIRNLAHTVMRLLDGKDVMVGVIDVATDVVETPEQVADTIEQALDYVPLRHLMPCTNCGLAPMDRDVALRKLHALGRGVALARQRLG